VGMKGVDVGSGSPMKYLLVYLGGSPGTKSGVTYTTQTPALPFEAAAQLHWSADNNSMRVMKWTGSNWADDAWDFTGLAYKKGDFVEIKIPRNKIGLPSKIALTMVMINSEFNHEGTFAGVPVGSFTDGKNPSFTKYYEFDLNGCVAPKDHPIRP